MNGQSHQSFIQNLKICTATPIKIQTTWGSTRHNKPWETRRAYHLKS